VAAGPDPTVLTGGFDSENITMPLNLLSAAAGSRLYGSGPFASTLQSILSSEPVTMNNHEQGVTPDNFAARPMLSTRFTALSTNVDRNGKPFVSSMEGKGGLPIFATQFHPEKVPFEWNPTAATNHGFDSILANQLLALVFVNQTRSNFRSFPDPQLEADSLIYQFNPLFTGLVHPNFQQIYFFDN
jgi:gamma-glutamyl hydrolase